MVQARISAVVVSVATVLLSLLPAQEAKSRATEHVLKKFDKSPYFVIPAQNEQIVKPHLLVVMPGGPGTKDFLPWVENGILGAASDGCMGVMVTAVKWRDKQRIVWPTQRSKVSGMRYTTEDYVLAVVEHVSREYDVDRGRVALLAWSSSGPAAYRLMTRARTPFHGAYIAMSVFPRLARSELYKSRRRRFVLDQSPQDEKTTFAHVRRAYEELHDSKAVVRLSTYEGGHGWHDSPIPRLRQNLIWLFNEDDAPEPVWPDGDGDGAGHEPPSKDGNLVKNASFEQGTKAGWRTIDNSGRLTVAIDVDNKTDGKQALHLQKTGAMPLDLVDQEVRLPRAGAGRKVRFAIQVKTAAVKNAWVKLWLYDENDEVTNRQDVNIAQLRGTADWQRYTKTLESGSAVRAVVQVILVMGGEVWLDDVVLTIDEGKK